VKVSERKEGKNGTKTARVETIPGGWESLEGEQEAGRPKTSTSQGANRSPKRGQKLVFQKAKEKGKTINLKGTKRRLGNWGGSGGFPRRRSILKDASLDQKKKRGVGKRGRGKSSS